MNNVMKKIVAAVMVLTVSVWIGGPSVAEALTADELQAQITALLAQLSLLQSQLTQIQGGTTGGAITGIPSGFTFATNLSQGSTGNDVKYLQIVLNSDAATQVAATGVGSKGNESTYFGALTKAAVVKFQNKYASEVLAPVGLTAGTGFVGSATRAKLNALLGAAPSTSPTPIPSGTASVSLAAGTPAATLVALNAQDAIFTKINFNGGTTGYTITQINVFRGGVAADADLASVKLYDGATQLGSTQALNSTTHKASFSGLTWQVPAGTVKTLTIKGSIAASGTATVGDGATLGIASASDIVTSATIAGTFPINGNTKTIAGISVGELDVDKQTTPATSTVLSGSTDQAIAAWKFTASSTEGFSVSSIKVTQVGSATNQDVVNLKLKVDGVQIGSTIANFDSQNSATFDLSAAPISVIAGGSKTVTAYADIASGIFTSRTVIFEITQATDVVANGANSGGVTTVTIGDNASFTKQTGNTMTVGQGALTVALDASLNPAAQSYVKGTSNRLITAIKFSAGSTEGVRVTKIKLTLGGTGNATDLSNITFWDGSTQVAGPFSVVGSTVTAGANTVGFDTTGLFDIAASANKTIQIKADIPTGATTGHTVSLSVSSASDVYADGLNSRYDIPSGSITASSVTGNAHTVAAKGSLAISKASTSPVAQTYVKGSTGKSFTTINLTAGSGEDVVVSAVTISINNADAEGLTSSIAATGLTNVRLLKADGTQFGTTVSSPADTAAFSGALVVKAAETQTLTVVADIPANTNATSIQATLSGESNITTTGVSSSGDITETSSATGNTITIAAGSLTIAAASTPADQTLVIGSTDIPFTGLTMTAGTSENVRVTSLKLWVSSSGQASTTDISNIYLSDGTNTLTSKKALTASSETPATFPNDTHHYVQFTASDFLNSLGVDVNAGQQKTIYVKADLPATGTNGHKVALGVSTTDDVATIGITSNSDITETLTTGPASASGVNYTYGTTAANINEVTLSSYGTLAMAVTADTPASKIIAVSSEGNVTAATDLLKVQFGAALENIDVKTITIERSGGSDADFASISLWDGSTQLGSSQSLVSASSTFSFTAGNYWRIPKGGAKVLTVKATLNGVASATGYGSATGDAPLVRVDNVTTQGASSGQSISGSTDLAGNTMYLRQSKPTLAAATLPTTLLNTGDVTLYKWTVSADSAGAISWKRIAFNITGTLASKAITASSSDPTYGTTDGIYVYVTGGAGSMIKMINNFKVWDVTNGAYLTATTTAFDGTAVTTTVNAIIRADADASNGYYVLFIPDTEEQIAAGSSKTYELRGTVLNNAALSTGDGILTKVADLSTTATTSSYGDVSRDAVTFTKQDKSSVSNYATTSASFLWSDRSNGSHTLYTADWTNDYKINGLPTATLSLSK